MKSRPITTLPGEVAGGPGAVSSGFCEMTYTVNVESFSRSTASTNGGPASGRLRVAVSASSRARPYAWIAAGAGRGGTIKPSVPTCPESGLKVVSPTMERPLRAGPAVPGSFVRSLRQTTRQPALSGMTTVRSEGGAPLPWVFRRSAVRSTACNTRSRVNESLSSPMTTAVGEPLSSATRSQPQTSPLTSKPSFSRKRLTGR